MIQKKKKVGRLPYHVVQAIKCGPVPKIGNWRTKNISSLTRAEKIMKFAEAYLLTPEGSKVGQPIKLELFQQAFFYSVFDNKHGTRRAILSVGRKNGKTVICAIILLAYICGPEAKENSMLSSGAMSREQASLVFRHMSKFINLNPALQAICKVMPSGKKILGLTKNVEYQALAAEGSTTVGRSDQVIIGDEWGQIVGSQSDFVDALTTSQGAFEDALQVIISTQSASDADLLSTWIDDAIVSGDTKIVCHLYTADKDCELDDKEQWLQSNPALESFRSVSDLSEQLKQAKRLPSQENSTRNLLLNQRITRETLWLAPESWKKCSARPDIEVFRNNPVSIGLDLSAKHDLTAAILSAKDEEGNVHVLPFVFCPTSGIEARSKRDRAPYDVWVKEGFMVPLGGNIMDYDQICNFMRDKLEELEIYNIQSIEFDRWRIDLFKEACQRENWESALNAEWNDVGQGFKDFSPRCESMEALLLESKIRHGNHPLLTMAASNAIAVRDAAGSIKIDKSKSTMRIDPLVAMVMSVHRTYIADDNLSDVSWLIG